MDIHLGVKTVDMRFDVIDNMGRVIAQFLQSKSAGVVELVTRGLLQRLLWNRRILFKLFNNLLLGRFKSAFWGEFFIVSFLCLVWYNF